MSSQLLATPGTDWLASRTNSEGSYSGTADIASVYQTTSEVLQTFHIMDISQQQPGVTAAQQFVNAQTYHNTENLYRKIIVLASAGQEVTTLVDELVNLQNYDGGFGELAGYHSSVLDTAFALRAFSTAGYSNTTVVNNAIAYLVQQQDPSGGFGLGDANTSSIYVTSQVSLSLQPYVFTYTVGNFIDQATNYLYSEQLSTGGWSTVWETAQALLAVIPATSDSSRYQEALTILQNAQRLDGSWGGDVFTTALAERVLFLASRVTLPSEPTAASIKGKVVNQNGLSLDGVTVSAVSAVSAYSGESNQEGSFTIQNLPAEAYTIAISLSGYETVIRSLTLQAGDLIDMGTIQLTPIAQQGVLQGVVTDYDTGLPLSGVNITTSGSSTVSATTDASGRYSAAISPGGITITVTATGYNTLSGSTSINAGQVVVFSPTLVPVTSTNPQTAVTVTGTVIDGASKAPISGASVTITGSATGQITTDSSGQFTLGDLSAGELIITVSATGYQSSSYSALASVGNTVNLGTVQLQQIVLPATSSANGTIVDRDTGAPINGATVTIEGTGLSATSDANGRYTFAGITSLQFSLFVSAPGYLSEFKSIRMAEVGVTTIDFSLQQASAEGISIDGLWTDQLVYNAYSFANITSVIRNNASTTSTVKILLEVFDSAEQPIQALIVNQTNISGVINDSYNILPGATFDLSSGWFTRNLSPGAYKIHLKVFDDVSKALLAERVTHVTLQESQVIEQANLISLPKSTSVATTENFKLLLSTVNKSNIDTTIELGYELISPSGQLVVSGQRSITLTPDKTAVTTELANEPITFSESGTYQAVFTVLSGVIPLEQNNTAITVAPAIRVEASQEVSPTRVVPDGDKRVRINIQLRGVESQ